jgi:outer membrane protein TolC
VESGYYQILLDDALVGARENVIDLRQVLNATQVAYSANQVAQTHFVSAEFALATARQTVQQLEPGLSNDKTTLNQLLFRRPDEPLILRDELHLVSMEPSLDQLIDLAKASRQEILETALAQQMPRPR